MFVTVKFVLLFYIRISAAYDGCGVIIMTVLRTITLLTTPFAANYRADGVDGPQEMEIN